MSTTQGLQADIDVRSASALRWVVLALAVCATSSSGLFLLRPIGGDLRRPLCLVSEGVAVVAAVAATQLATRRVAGVDRRSWNLLTVAVLLGLGGTVLNLTARLDPRAALVAMTLAAPFAVAALGGLALAKGNRRAWRAATVEAFMLAGAVFTAVWALAENLVPGLADVSVANRALLMGGPFAYLLIAGFAGAMFLSSDAPATRTLQLVAGWASLSAVGLILAVDDVIDGRSVPVESRLILIVGVLLLVLASAAPEISRHVALASQRASAQRGFVTVCPMVVVGLVAVGEVLGHVSQTVELMALILVPAVILRLIITSQENQGLVERLENRLALLRVRERETTAARAAAVAAQEAERLFLTNTSHELRTPLHAVLGFAELLTLEPLTESQALSLDQIRESGGYLLELVDDLLDLARVEQGQIETVVEPFVLAEVFDEVCRHIEPMAVSHRASVVVAGDTGEHDVMVLADRRRLRQVLTNLVANALKYAGGKVVLEAEVTDGRVSIHVCDSGPGIAAEQLSRLFIPFDRLDANRGAMPGAGLGLPVARSLVYAMGGEVSVASTLGIGTRFTVSLPAGKMRRLINLTEKEYAL
jgi:signal transduction histidine kinase